MSFRKPMLAGKAPSMDLIKYPVLASPKLDGIRAIKCVGGLYSRNGKLIPNQHTQNLFAKLPVGFDGELIVGERTGEGVMNRTSSGVMKKEGEPNVKFWVFDWMPPVQPIKDGVVWAHYDERLTAIDHWFQDFDPLGNIPSEFVDHERIETPDQMMDYENQMVAAGFEGVMIRDPYGAYKYGRSTPKQGGLLKIKRWEDAEAVVVGAVRKYRNENEAKKNALGHTERSTKKEGKVPLDELGALVCVVKNPEGEPVEFEIGTGFTQHQRVQMWKAREDLYGKSVRFKFQEWTEGGKAPRFPVWEGMREDLN